MNEKKNTNAKDNLTPKTSLNGSEPQGRDSGYKDAIPGINTPGIELPAFNPPVPNRAWTAMRAGLDIDALTEEEKRDLYYGRDDVL